MQSKRFFQLRRIDAAASGDGIARTLGSSVCKIVLQIAIRPQKREKTFPVFLGEQFVQPALVNCLGKQLRKVTSCVINDLPLLYGATSI